MSDGGGGQRPATSSAIPRNLVLPRVDEPVLERRRDDQVDEREHGRDDEQKRQGEPRADGLEVSHGSRSR